ncbi:uncharacterized protein LOC122815054 [Protopterus annectens]|uniref:uncharacterized protein LOC122815054 n=1 Tax=Protopterus annectens TaxID=7888 RepID=UPI001CFAE53E|nr:uncharacterized protein LOC122815054 [Protopterus annectens]
MKMILKFVLHALFVCFFTGVHCQVKLEESGGRAVTPGASLQLNCKATGFDFGPGSDYGMNWVRQQPGKGLEWVAYHYTSSGGTNYIFYSPSVQGRFTISRDVPQRLLHLDMKNVKTEDTGTYYCARGTVRENCDRSLQYPVCPLLGRMGNIKTTGEECAMENRLTAKFVIELIDLGDTLYTIFMKICLRDLHTEIRELENNISASSLFSKYISDYGKLLEKFSKLDESFEKAKRHKLNRDSNDYSNGQIFTWPKVKHNPETVKNVTFVPNRQSNHLNELDDVTVPLNLVQQSNPQPDGNGLHQN